MTLVNDTRPDRHFGCQAVMEALEVFLARCGLKVGHTHPVGRDWETDPEFRAKAALSSAIIVNGEGTLHHNTPRAVTLSRIASFAQQTLRVPAVLLNATLAANDDRIYSHLRHFNLTCVRDSASAVELGVAGLPQPLYAPDFSLFHDFSRLRRADPAAKPARVGVTDSILPRVAGQLERCRVERGLLNSSILIRNARSIYDYAQEIADLDLLVTGRYHAVCFALNTGTPFVAVESNSPKITSLLMDVFGNTRRLITPEAVETLNFEEFSGWTEQESADLERFGAVRTSRYAELATAVTATLNP